MDINAILKQTWGRLEQMKNNINVTLMVTSFDQSQVHKLGSSTCKDNVVVIVETITDLVLKHGHLFRQFNRLNHTELLVVVEREDSTKQERSSLKIMVSIDEVLSLRMNKHRDDIMSIFPITNKFMQGWM